jgi:hypothetical protein
VIDKSSPEFAAALAQASAEHRLQDYYRDCVRPLLSTPMHEWPQCCGGGCEPCSQVLVAVAARVCELLNVDPHTLTRG